MLKLEDWPALVQLHCNAEAWDRAFMTVKRCPEDEPALYETYAEWLVTHGRCAQSSACVIVRQGGRLLRLSQHYPELDRAGGSVVASRYDEARRAFAESTKPYKAARILEDLCACAVKRQEFKEAAYYCYQIAREILMVRGVCCHACAAAAILCSPLMLTPAALSGCA